MTSLCHGLRHPVHQLILAASLLSLVLSSLPPPKENFRKVEKKILDKLFSPEVYDNRMRPKGKPLKVKRYINWPTIVTFLIDNKKADLSFLLINIQKIDNVYPGIVKIIK